VLRRSNCASRLTLEGATVVPLRKAVEPDAVPMAFGDTRILTPLELTRRFESPAGQKEYRAWSQLLVATPAVLSYLGLEPSAVDPGADFLVDRGVVTDRLFIPSISGRKLLPVANVQKLDLGRRLFGFASAPPNLITLAGLRRHGWNQVPAGWLVESSKPMTSDQTAEARDVASQAGLTIEVQHEADSLARVMAIAIGAGGLLALAVLALTVGLIRSESAGDLRTLTATGATSEDPPQIDGLHRRGARPPGRNPRRGRRLRRPRGDLPRRPRVSERRAGPASRPRTPRRTRGRRRGRLARRRPRAVRDRKTGA
jgi:hypothetical protein